VLVAGSLGWAACGSAYPGATLSDQLSGWAKATGFTGAVSQIQGDLRRVAPYRPGPEAGAWKTDCDVLVTDALTANQNLPSPDQRLTDQLSAAYSQAGSAGHDCLNGVSGVGLTRFDAERTTAARDLIKALARYDSVITGVTS
jgi:hypothetical protein